MMYRSVFFNKNRTGNTHKKGTEVIVGCAQWTED